MYVLRELRSVSYVLPYHDVETLNRICFIFLLLFILFPDQLAKLLKQAVIPLSVSLIRVTRRCTVGLS